MFLTDLYQFLRDSPTVSTDQIYPHVLPADPPNKGITFELVSTERRTEHSGETDDRSASVQLNVWGKRDFDGCMALAEELETALTNFTGELVPGGSDVGLVRIDNEFSGYESETESYRVTYLMTIDYTKP